MGTWEGTHFPLLLCYLSCPIRMPDKRKGHMPDTHVRWRLVRWQVSTRNTIIREAWTWCSKCPFLEHSLATYYESFYERLWKGQNKERKPENKCLWKDDRPKYCYFSQYLQCVGLILFRKERKRHLSIVEFSRFFLFWGNWEKGEGDLVKSFTRAALFLCDRHFPFTHKVYKKRCKRDWENVGDRGKKREKVRTLQ